ncbi:MAG: hypothetical protein V4722_17665 [Bacteroidota bacterium]
MKLLSFVTLLLLLTAVIFGCDSTSAYQANEAAIIKKMKGKVQKVQTELRQHCDSVLYREARRIVDSISNSKNSKAISN